MVLIRGGSRVFSRGDSLKKIENFVSTFFRPTKFSFQSVPEYSIFGHFLESFDEKIAFVGTLWKVLTKKVAFFLARVPPQI